MTVLSLCTADDEPSELGDVSVERVRRQFFEGLASKPVFAKAVGRTVRTVDIWVNQGMPVVYLGQTPFVVIDPAKKWLLSRRQAHPNMPRRGGRLNDDASPASPESEFVAIDVDFSKRRMSPMEAVRLETSADLLNLLRHSAGQGRQNPPASDASSNLPTAA